MKSARNIEFGMRDPCFRAGSPNEDLMSAFDAHLTSLKQSHDFCVAAQQSHGTEQFNRLSDAANREITHAQFTMENLTCTIRFSDHYRQRWFWIDDHLVFLAEGFDFVDSYATILERDGRALCPHCHGTTKLISRNGVRDCVYCDMSGYRVQSIPKIVEGAFPCPLR